MALSLGDLQSSLSSSMSLPSLGTLGGSPSIASTGGDDTCGPDGFTPDGAPCTPTQHNCNTGYHWDSGAGYCVQDDRPPTSTDCPDGQTYVGRQGKCLPDCQGLQTRDDSGNCVGSPGGGGTGGGPTGLTTGGGTKAAAPYIPKAPAWDMENDPIWKQLTGAISDALAGKTTFDKDTIERMKGAARIRSENLRDVGKQRITSNLVGRGIADSPIGVALTAEADRAADADYSSTASQIEVQAQIQNYQDRTGALDRAERLLNSRMSYVLGLANNDIQRAEVALAYRRIDEARDALDKQLAAQMAMQQAGFDFDNMMFQQQLPIILAQLLQGYQGGA